MESVVNEKDWKLFREKMPEWQNRYMDRLNREYIKLLNGEGKASDKFWALHDRIKEGCEGYWCGGENESIVDGEKYRGAFG